MSKLTNILLGISTLGLFAFNPKINAQTIINENYKYENKGDTLQFIGKDTIICVPAYYHNDSIFFLTQKRDTIFIKGDSVFFKSKPIYFSDTIFQSRYDQEAYKNKVLQRQIDSLLSIKENSQEKRDYKKEIRKENIMARKEEKDYDRKLKEEKIKPKKEEEDYAKQNRREKSKEKDERTYVKKEKEDRFFNKFTKVTGEIGRYAVLSPYIIPYTIGKSILNVTKDCPCDKKTGEKIPKKVNGLWLKNLKKKSNKTKTLSPKKPSNKFAIKCPKENQ